MEYLAEPTTALNGVVKKTYTYDEALQKSLQYFHGDELAANVWINKYALKDSAGNLFEASPTDMHWRMAKELARIERKYPNPLTASQIFEALDRFRYIIPQGGPMTGIGNQYQIASLSNCFVIGQSGSSDSYGAIMKDDEEQVQLMKRRGGVGHDLSHIRPKGSPVKNSALTSTGVVPFMERFSNSTREVAQDGRRGALMLSISIDHPDAEQFIDAKLDGTKVTGANVSVRLSDAFMNAVRSKKPFQQSFPVNCPDPWFVREANAHELWQKIVHNAWKSAEPGVLFWDTIKRESIPDCYADQGFQTTSTNPCGEIPLCPYDSCRLLAMNLFSFVQNPFTDDANFDLITFKKYIHIGQRIADDIIDLELEKIDAILRKIDADPESESIKRTERELWVKIREKCISGRRTGTGITGEGDMLAALGIRYGSEHSLEFSEEVHKFMALEVYRTSVALAKERGSFPIYNAENEKDNPFVQRLKHADASLYESMVKHGRRNIAALTIAPTGTTSLMSQTSSGLEPVFMVGYKRRRKINPNDSEARVDFTDDLGDCWQEYYVLHPKFADWMQVHGVDPAEAVHMSVAEMDALIARSPYHGATAQDIDWVSKVKLQGRIQQWIDHSISATVNVPNASSEDLIAEIYETAWESGCKGITVYRDGSRSGVLVGSDTPDKTPSSHEPPKRPSELEADVMRFKNNDEDWIAVIGILNGSPYEIFTGRAEDSFRLPKYVKDGVIIKSKEESGKSRYDFQYQDRDGYKTTIEGLSRSFDPEFWNYAKLISGVLRHDMPLHYVVHMINNLHLNDDSLNTWKNGVSRALKRYIPSGTTAVDKTCSSCGEDTLTYEEGCLVCRSCGESKCS
jgi:ribonucleoside-diphosphate reductase alpha chain